MVATCLVDQSCTVSYIQVIPPAFMVQKFFCAVFSFLSRWSFVDVALMFPCPADHVPGWQLRILLVKALMEKSERI